MVVEVSLQPELVAGDPIARRDPAGHGSGTWTGAAGVPRRGRLRICRSATARLIAQAAPTSSAVGRFPAPKIAAPKPRTMVTSIAAPNTIRSGYSTSRAASARGKNWLSHSADSATPNPATPTGPRSITEEATEHPDLYAREFVKHLLTHDYRTPRAQLLAWVQSEAVQTSEPLVIGMVPPQLRDKWAVFSVTDSTGGMAPIPVKDEWARLAQLHGYTIVEVQRVSEPMAWSSAVSSGQITDAGVTGREVTAQVTLHTVQDGRAKQSVSSVALTLNLEGPPVRPDWGFVTVVTYTELPVTPR